MPQARKPPRPIAKRKRTLMFVEEIRDLGPEARNAGEYYPAK